ncbi:MAG TPA: septal ring lytic transglycosylase RlpA family protein [Xanthobacteraceae bacterium]|jgi:rare lipoprotein A|nr:septal ring lytic transglycosylase RlpA family protein [Xanthobacteraceae bacterium]
MPIRLIAALIAVALVTASCSGPAANRGPIGTSSRTGAATAHARAVPAMHAPATAAANGASVGVASYYDAGGLTAAHRTLPFGTRVRVTNTTNGRSVVVRIADRGPYIHGRSIDLSHSAAAAVGMTETGLARVRMEVLQ